MIFGRTAPEGVPARGKEERIYSTSTILKKSGSLRTATIK